MDVFSDFREIMGSVRPEVVFITSFLQKKIKQTINTFLAKRTLAAWITTDFF